ncbi:MULTISPECIES: HNH endonuclease family protein [Sphingobacterium]|uniref:HNH nuclease domain-containing protein n=1 Tax=Sphingobacterium cellulitidis TaxID=1768011 RepID=A0A8H9KTK7_9SPHI|nr:MULTISPECIES: hypothetical protein [Sphingobacterium]MBA8986798.1 hypothetical protein [Sphingobacterium soli]WFB64989.1 hypothetical protein PZ892_07185 [Sphingobacterium sp. WM]GGE14064.1 hypothetical protein GCM10011516_09810 [Sphingobacterium soli]
MIKLEYALAPIELSEDFIKQNTEEYKKKSTHVWGVNFIKEGVYNSSFGKCCYSESQLNVEGKYMEIDHFFPKIHFPHLILEWTNLLPSNKKCNTTKGDLNPLEIKIINPYSDNPKEHLYVKNFRYYHLTPIGKNTIDYTAINDYSHFTKVRSEICLEIIDELDYLNDNLTEAISSKSLRKTTITINKIKNLLKNGFRTQTYAAVISTTILADVKFIEIREILTRNEKWDSELNDIISELEYCALPSP